MRAACDVARPGGAVGCVGVPWAGAVRLAPRRRRSRRAYIPELTADVVAGRIDPSAVLDLRGGLEEAPARGEAHGLI